MFRITFDNILVYYRIKNSSLQKLIIDFYFSIQREGFQYNMENEYKGVLRARIKLNANRTRPCGRVYKTKLH
jgi:hypothetical protein